MACPPSPYACRRCPSSPCARCGLAITPCATDHASVCVARSRRQRDALQNAPQLGATLRLLVGRIARNDDVADVILEFACGGAPWTAYAVACMTCGLRRSDYWPNREYGRRTFVRRCDLDAHYGACHAELRCATCGAATTRAGRHRCAAPWLEDYDVACPAGCGEVFRRSFLATHAVGCVVSARELPGLPGLGRAAGGWTSDARFWRERGPPCWRRADERGGNWPEIPDD